MTTESWHASSVTEALYHMRRYNYKQAELIISRALKNNPTYRNALRCEFLLVDHEFSEAGKLFNRGMYGEALLGYCRVLDKAPKKPSYAKMRCDCYRLAGESLIRTGRVDEALKFIAEALELNDKDAGALCTKALALGKLGKFKEARLAISKALEIDPTCKFAHFYKNAVGLMEMTGLVKWGICEFGKYLVGGGKQWKAE